MTETVDPNKNPQQQRRWADLSQIRSQQRWGAPISLQIRPFDASTATEKVARRFPFSRSGRWRRGRRRQRRLELRKSRCSASLRPRIPRGGERDEDGGEALRQARRRWDRGAGGCGDGGTGKRVRDVSLGKSPVPHSSLSSRKKKEAVELEKPAAGGNRAQKKQGTTAVAEDPEASKSRAVTTSLDTEEGSIEEVEGEGMTYKGELGSDSEGRAWHVHH